MAKNDRIIREQLIDEQQQQEKAKEQVKMSMNPHMLAKSRMTSSMSDLAENLADLENQNSSEKVDRSDDIMICNVEVP